MASKKLKTTLIILLTLLILFIINKFFFFPTRNFLFSIFSPLQKISWQAGNNISGLTDGIFRAKNISRENEELKKENFFLIGKALKANSLKKENEELRQALDLKLKKGYSLIMADVVSKELNDSLLINKGKNDGVKNGLPVINSANVLVGRTSKVFADYSQLVLISQKDFSFSANVQKEGGTISGLCRGRGNLGLTIELLPKNNSFLQGDIISTSVLGGVFPQGLLVGEIKKINNSDTGSFQKGEVKPYFLGSKLRKLFIIANFNALKKEN